MPEKLPNDYRPSTGDFLCSADEHEFIHVDFVEDDEVYYLRGKADDREWAPLRKPLAVFIAAAIEEGLRLSDVEVEAHRKRTRELFGEPDEAES